MSGVRVPLAPLVRGLEARNSPEPRAKPRANRYPAGMATAQGRRGHGDDSVDFDAANNSDVRAVLTKIGEENSSRTVQITRNCMVRAITHAQANDHVVRNVAALVKEAPQGQGNGRPSKSLTPEQAVALLGAAKNLGDGKPSRLETYILLCLMTGIRTEEVRALRWDHVDLDNATVAVWRSVRAHGGARSAVSR